MDRATLIAASVRLTAFVDAVGDGLSSAARQHVAHYLEIGEVEMACESLVLSLNDERVVLSQSEKADLLEVCRTVRLHEESVFRDDAWQLAQNLTTNRP